MVLLTLNSKDRISGSSSDFLVKINNPPKNISQVCLREVILPNSIYNINSSNNMLYFEVGSTGVANLSIPPGFYNTLSLVTKLNERFTAIGVATTVTYDSTNNKYTFTHPSIFNLYFGYNNTLVDILGFNTINYNNSLNGSITSPRVGNLNSVYSLYIIVKELGTPNLNSKNLHYTFKLSLNANTNTILYQQSKIFYDQRIQLTNVLNSNLGDYNVKLVYDDGNAVDLNGLNWELTVDFY